MNSIFSVYAHEKQVNVLLLLQKFGICHLTWSCHVLIAVTEGSTFFLRWHALSSFLTHTAGTVSLLISACSSGLKDAFSFLAIRNVSVLVSVKLCLVPMNEKNLTYTYLSAFFLIYRPIYINLTDYKLILVQLPTEKLPLHKYSPYRLWASCCCSFLISNSQWVFSNTTI